MDQRDSAEKIEPIEPTEPTDPIDKIDPAEPMLRIDPADPIDKIDPLDPMLRIDPTDPTDRTDLPVFFAMLRFSHPDQPRPSDMVSRAPAVRQARTRSLGRVTPQDVSRISTSRPMPAG
jgi:hypothetical protein